MPGGLRKAYGAGEVTGLEVALSWEAKRGHLPVAAPPREAAGGLAPDGEPHLGGALTGRRRLHHTHAVTEVMGGRGREHEGNINTVREMKIQ